MLALLLRRLVAVVPILLITSLGVFMLGSLVPGDPAVTLAGGLNATPERVSEIRQELNLNDPLIIQYGYWLVDAVQLDFGTSLFTDVPVMTAIAGRLGVTLQVVGLALVVGLILGVPLGTLAGIRAERPMDHLARIASTLGVAIPNFCIAIALVFFLGVAIDLLPPSGYVSITESPLEWVQHLIMPAIALGIALAAVVARQLRASVCEVLESNFVRTAWAKGAGTGRVISGHVLKNASLAPLTIFGVQLGYLIGGTVIIEQIFSIPGLGTLMLRAIMRGDLPLVQGITVVFILFQVGIALLIDILYGFINPKIRVQ